MPTEGLTQEEARHLASRKERMEKNSAPADKRRDAIGLTLFGISALLFISLAIGKAGFIGELLGGVTASLFGAGAWVVAGLFALAGVAFVVGRTPKSTRRSLIGCALIFLGGLGLFARPVKGDYFDPDAIMSSGGYLGAIIAGSFDALFGAARPVLLVLLIVAGVGLWFDAPLRALVMNLRGAFGTRGPARPMPKKSRDGEGEEDLTPKPEPKRRNAKPLRLEKPKPEEKPVELAPVNERPKGDYQLPPLSLLTPPDGKVRRSASEMQKNIEALENTLEQFNIDATVTEVATGPTITRYEIQLGPGIRVSRIKALADNIAMGMAASHVRLEAPIPGKSAIGVEVPNAKRAMVTLRELCENLEFHDGSLKLCMALGKDVSGHRQYADLTRMPHLLIGGATNSGKSISLAGIIMSLILRNTPKDLRLVMIDPKRVELSLFEGLPHLMCPVVKDVKEAPGVLRAVWREMDRRYDQFSEEGVRNIDGWNAKKGEDEQLPYIVVIIDELADLMMQAANEVEASICRLAQLARATGIHLIIATQRPSVDVITGTIKANISSRIAFSVSSQIDSRTILDQSGAEKLIGRGDMLFLPIDGSKPTRIQGAYVSEAEIESVCTHWRNQEKPHYVLNPVQIAIEEKEAELKQKDEELDDLWEEAVRFVVERQSASTSMLQRKFSIGFQRASRLLDAMEERNVVGERDGPRPREVLVELNDLDTMFSSGAGHLSPVPEGEYIEDED